MKEEEIREAETKEWKRLREEKSEVSFQNVFLLLTLQEITITQRRLDAKFA